MGAQEIIEEVEDNLDERFRLVEAKTQTLIVRFNELLSRLQVSMNCKFDYLKISEDE